MEFRRKGSSKNWLKIIPLGGTSDVTKNMYVYETPRDILVVDAGIGFPRDDMLGVDVVVPDISYLLARRDKVRGILISHGHEDHFGALPYIISDLGVPIYSSKLVDGFIEKKLAEANLLKGTRRHVIDPTKKSFSIGDFTIYPFLVNHSVPEPLGFAIRTPAGMVFHVSDFKFDWTPVSGRPFEVDKMVRLAREGVLVLLSDCLGANKRGYTASEREIGTAFDQVLDQAEGRQVIVTTISSNISRIQQVVDTSLKHDRKVVLLGRSINQNVEVACRLGYLNVSPKVLVVDSRASRHPQERLTYVATGCYAQKNSALARIADGSHRTIRLAKKATVVFSADPIPGLNDQIDALIDRLTLRGAEVLYSEVREGLHTSGHGGQGDLLMLAALVKPRYLIPIGGTPKYMRSYTKLVTELGHDESNVFELVEGQTVHFEGGKASLGEKVLTSNVYVDGSIVGDIGEVILKDRQTLAEDGVVVAMVPFSKEGRRPLGRVEIVTRGFVYVKEARELLEQARQVAQKALPAKGKHVPDWSAIRTQIEKDLAQFFYGATRRKPLVLVVKIEV
ncbi:ribonuclease J [Candidatus Parcubacteria bacterium]|nr:ribonuclease J [Candidatus Parcubacteria bacterium]